MANQHVLRCARTFASLCAAAVRSDMSPPRLSCGCNSRSCDLLDAAAAAAACCRMALCCPAPGTPRMLWFLRAPGHSTRSSIKWNPLQRHHCIDLEKLHPRTWHVKCWFNRCKWPTVDSCANGEQCVQQNDMGVLLLDASACQRLLSTHHLSLRVMPSYLQQTGNQVCQECCV